MTPIQTLLYAAAGVSLCAGVAHAQDDRFTGFYVGGQGGYDTITADVTQTDGVDTIAIQGVSLSGAEGGGFIGYGFVNQGVYFGVEAFASHSSADLSITDTTIGATVTLESGFAYGGAARIGFLPADNALVYVKGAIQETKFTAGVTGIGSGDEYLTGYGAGGGVEVAVSPEASLRFDYQHLWYEDLSDSAGGITTVYESDAGRVSLGLVFRI